MGDFQSEITVILVTVISTILIWKLYNKSSHADTNLPPTPFRLPIIGHLHLLSPSAHRAFHKLSMRYGPVFRVFLGSTPCVVVTSPEIPKQVFKVHEHVFLDRPQNSIVDYISYGCKGFIFAPYGSYWTFMKKITMSQLLNGKTLDFLLPVRRDEINHFIKYISLKAKAGESVELEMLLGRMTNNVISRMVTGKRCSEDEDEAGDMMKIMDEVDKLYGKFNLSDHIWTYFLGGTDTAARNIEWALSELINHPNIMKKAVDEIDQVVGKNRLLQESDIPNLPYLQEIVKETLRLYPTSPMPQRLSRKDCIVGEFRPERFEDKQTDVRGQHFHFLPFGSGRRMCPGVSLGLILVHVTLGSMIQCFTWKAGKCGDLTSVDMEEGITISLPRANPLVCVPDARLDPVPLSI
ncbi:hypothetical protein L1987_60843 [Smallanthus sonchifolius]|uniref:Uncharacterized protein n=1 Tax=Smallanthus sonchifolius TaxID=185202 RepID=A0ACB9D9I1_9ASTR|nr:hypothetical protein L1987_60843 [Smallanthus sonchifolius]